VASEAQCGAIDGDDQFAMLLLVNLMTRDTADLALRK
jgi:hypothetical protein